MVDSLAGIVLCAGAGTRLKPVTDHLPKVLCPVAGTSLVDHNLARVGAVVGHGPVHLAVNAHDRAIELAAHVGDRAHVSVERGEALGTAGGVAHLRPWLAGRPALVVNGDTWTTVAFRGLLDGWSGDRVRVMVHGERPELRPGVGIVGCLLPPAAIAGLPHKPAGLLESCWGPAAARGDLEVVAGEGPFVACDTPSDYLAANLAANGGRSVVGEGAVVEGTLVRSVVWPGGLVGPTEELVDAIRIGEHVTILCRA